MNRTDGFTLASAAAALMMSSAMVASAPAQAADAPAVKVSQCQGLASCHGQSACKGFGNANAAGKNSCSGIGFVGISSGHEMLSKSLCERLGGTQVGSIALEPAAKVGPVETADAVQVAYCNDLFTCAGFSACKGNGNDNCASKNSCHGIGFVGISSGDIKLSQQLCEKLGGALISSL